MEKKKIQKLKYILFLIVGLFLIFIGQYLLHHSISPTSDYCRQLGDKGYFEDDYSENVRHESCITENYTFEECKFLLPFWKSINCIPDYSDEKYGYNFTCDDRLWETNKFDMSGFNLRCNTNPITKFIFLFPIILGIFFTLKFFGIFSLKKEKNELQDSNKNFTKTIGGENGRK